MSTLCKCGKQSRKGQRTCKVCHAAYMRGYRKAGGRMGKLLLAINAECTKRKKSDADPEYGSGYLEALKWVKAQISGS